MYAVCLVYNVYYYHIVTLLGANWGHKCTENVFFFHVCLVLHFIITKNTVTACIFNFFFVYISNFLILINHFVRVQCHMFLLLLLKYTHCRRLYTKQMFIFYIIIQFYTIYIYIYYYSYYYYYTIIDSYSY